MENRGTNRWEGTRLVRRRPRAAEIREPGSRKGGDTLAHEPVPDRRRRFRCQEVLHVLAAHVRCEPGPKSRARKFWLAGIFQVRSLVHLSWRHFSRALGTVRTR